MKNQLSYLLKRDIKRTLSLRTIFIWVCMSFICVFFFFTSNGQYNLVDKSKVEFMSIMLPQIIFGAWAVLSVYFDLISSDRECNVLDLILCSGVKKNKVLLSKLITSAVVSLILSLLYLLPITIVIINISHEIGYLALLPQYFLPLWGYIMVFASIAIVISVVFRSSKAAMIWSLSIGLILMPRFFMLIVEGLGEVFNWTQATKNAISMLSPGILMEALSDFSNISKIMAAVKGFSAYIVVFLVIALFIFHKQDELSYGE